MQRTQAEFAPQFSGFVPAPAEKFRSEVCPGEPDAPHDDPDQNIVETHATIPLLL
jgi:hypothetical protein